MKTCQYHWDGDVCEDCKNYYTQEKKVESKPEPKLESVTNSEKKESLSGTLIGSMVICGLIIGFMTLIGWLIVPGFLKPDKEVVFLNMDGALVQRRGKCVVKYILENEIESQFIEIDKIDVVLRNDGKPYTTLLQKDRSLFYPDFHSATILVPNAEGLEKWNKYLYDCRSERAAYLKWGESLNSPKEILPRN